MLCSYEREARHINEVRDHIVSEHWDALNQAVNTTREEVMARREDSKLLQERLGQPTGARKKTRVGQ